MNLNRRRFLGLTSAAAALATASARPATEEDPLGVRADFPAARRGVYLNSAYIAPSPLPVLDAGRDFLERKAASPVPLDAMLEKTDGVRGRFARLIGASNEEVGFVFATSEGENILSRSLDFKPGDNVVVDALHYDTTFVLYRHLEESRGIELRIVPSRDGAVRVEDFDRFIDRRTRLVSVAWVSHQNGFYHDLRPLADLAHARGALLYTDAIQALGMLALDVREAGIDCMTSGTYKWLLGGFAPAPFFVRQALLDRVSLDRYGALHVEKDLGDHRYRLYRSARKFDYATLPFAELYQLDAALAYLERVGIGRIEAHTVSLAAELRDGLAERGFSILTPKGNRSSIVAFVNPKGSAEARDAFAGDRVQVSLRENGKRIRVSPALFNNREDIRTFLDAVGRLA